MVTKGLALIAWIAANPGLSFAALVAILCLSILLAFILAALALARSYDEPPAPPAEPLPRWRVTYSTHREGWNYCDTTEFVSAATADEARRLVLEAERDPGASRHIWALSPATPEMERAHQAQQARAAAWLKSNLAGASNQRPG
jgi:hypothetical protein